jgi:hypothetical protein
VEELKAVQQYLASCNRRVEVVSVAWLELCHEEQRCVPVDARCRLQLASLMRGSSSHPLGAAGAGALGSGGATGGLAAGGFSTGGGGVFADTASRGGFPDAADRQQQDGAGVGGGWVPEFWQEQPTDPLKLYDGCYFTLAAVQVGLVLSSSPGLSIFAPARVRCRYCSLLACCSMVGKLCLCCAD